MPEQVLALLTERLGLEFTVTVPLALAVHPDTLVAVTVYVPAADLFILDVVSPLLHK